MKSNYFPDFIKSGFNYYCNGCELHEVELVHTSSGGILIDCIHAQACDRIQNRNDESYRRQTYLDVGPAEYKMERMYKEGAND